MNKALEVLYNEHEVIKSVINYREKLAELSKNNNKEYGNIMTLLIDFFRNYADKYHHYKEEKILFPLLCEKNDMLRDNIVAEMLDNHSEFRSLVKAIETSIISVNFEESNKLVFKYTEMLLDHIAVEDEELFQMAESLLDDGELEKLYHDFMDIDRELGIDTKIDLEKLREKLELV